MRDQTRILWEEEIRLCFKELELELESKEIKEANKDDLIEGPFQIEREMWKIKIKWNYNKKKKKNKWKNNTCWWNISKNTKKSAKVLKKDKNL